MKRVAPFTKNVIPHASLPNWTQWQMQDEWTIVGRGGQLVKFTYSDELPDGKAFLTAQIAGHEVVCSVILSQPDNPFSREGVENHFQHGTDFGLWPREE